MASIQNHGKDCTGTVGDRIADGILQYVEKLPDSLNELYMYISQQNAIRTNSDIANRIISLISCTQFGLREQDLKAIIVSLHGITELEFYYIFNYISYQLLCDYEGRYSLRIPVSSIDDLKNSSVNLLWNYLESLPVNNIIRRNELAYLYAFLNMMDKSLEEFSIENILSGERKVALYKLLEDYHDELNKEIMKMNFADTQTLQYVLNLSYNLLWMSDGESCTQIIFDLAKSLAKKALVLEHDDVNIAYIFGILQNLSTIAHKTYHEEEKRIWDSKANELFQSIMKTSLPDDMGLLTVFFKIVQIQMQIAKDIEKVRKGLDQGYPDELLTYIMKTTEKKYEQIHALSKDYVPLVMIIPGYGHILGVFYELQGDLMLRNGNRIEAFSQYKIAMEIIDSYDEHSGGNRSALYMKMGNICEKTGDIRQSLRYYENAYHELLEMKEETFSDDAEVNMALALAHMGNSYMKMEEYETAYRYLKKANDRFRSLYETAGTIQSIGDYATGLFKIGELALESGKRNKEGREAALQAAMLMYELVERTNGPEWINNLKMCMGLFKKLGGRV